MWWKVKRFWSKCKRIIRWLPVIWKSEDWDYNYALDVFKFKLTEIQKYLEDDKKCHSLNHKHYASRIKTAIELMDKVYNEDYALEYFKEIENLYGESTYEFIEIEETKDKPKSQKLYTLNDKFEKDYTDEELEKIAEHKRELFLKSHKKQERAHKLLWKFIEHNIQHWWD